MLPRWVCGFPRLGAVDKVRVSENYQTLLDGLKALGFDWHH